MPAALILNASQAEAVYSAMCALNNVYAVIHEIEMEDGRRLRTAPDGSYVLTMRDGHGQRIVEAYPTQNAFATAYGLLPREPVAEVAENFVFMLRKQPNGDRWPVGTKLYA